MKSVTLDRKTKAKAKAVLALLVISLLMQEIDKKLGRDEDNPAVSHVVAYIDEVMAPMSAELKAAVHHRVNRARKRLTAKTADFELSDGLIAAMRLLTGGMFKTRPGTRLDYIVGTFRENLKNIEMSIPKNEDQVNKFKHQLLIVLREI